MKIQSNIRNIKYTNKKYTNNIIGNYNIYGGKRVLNLLIILNG